MDPKDIERQDGEQDPVRLRARLNRINGVENVLKNVIETESYGELARYLLSLEERIEQLEREVRGG